MIAPASPDPNSPVPLVADLLRETESTVIAEKIILKDSDGKARVVIQAQAHGGAIALLEPESHRLQALIATNGDGTGLVIYDSEGRERISLSTSNILADLVVRDVSDNPIVSYSI